MKALRLTAWQQPRALVDVPVPEPGPGQGLAGGKHLFSAFAQPWEVSFATTYRGSTTELMEVLALAQTGPVTPTTACRRAAWWAGPW